MSKSETSGSIPTTEQVPALVSTLFQEMPTSDMFAATHAGNMMDAKRERLVRFDSGRFREWVQMSSRLKPSASGALSEITLHLFKDLELDLEITKIEQTAAQSLLITGRVVGDPDSEATLLLRNDSLIGDIYAQQIATKIDIRPLGQGAHVIREIHIDDGEDSVHAPPSEEPDEQSRLTLASEEDSNPVIDILVAYTPRARAAEGGTEEMEALIQRGISDANLAFENSGAKTRVRLVGTIETQQNETNSLASDLNSLMSKRDGRWDEVHAERDRVRADQVSLVGLYRGVRSPSGIGFYNARPDSAFTVLKTAAFSRYTLVHELGHNLGLDHSDGWKSNRGRFSTIMAYGSRRILRFSNPELTYNGFAMGSGRHNEVAILDRNAPRLASFR